MHLETTTATVLGMRIATLLAALACRLSAQSGSVDGTAIDAVTREPLSGVHVRLIGANFTGLTATYGAMSDRTGHFSIAMIRPGTYILYPERGGYLHVQPKGGSEIPRIAIKAGEKVTGYVLEMTQRAVISGRVVDEAGDPVQGARMVTVAVTPGEAPILFSPPGMVMSDDHGEFRLVGQPGKFYVQATPPSQNPYGNERPEKRSDGSNGAAYATTFFPSAVRKERATAVEAVAGKEVAGLEVRLGRVQQGVSLGGTVSGVPAGNNRGTVLMQWGESAERITSSRSTPVGADGRYRFDGLAPTYYRVWAIYNGGDRQSLVSLAKEGQLEGELANVDLALAPGLELSGTVKLEGEAVGAGAGAGAAVKRKVRVEAVGSYTFTSIPITGGEVDAAGNFTIRGIAPGKYRVAVSPLPENGYVKSVEVDGAAAVNQVADLSRAAGGATVKVVLAGDGGQITGRVVEDNGAAPSGLVMLFLGRSAEELEMSNDPGRLGADGKFTLHGIAPGKYRLVAIDFFQMGGSGAGALERIRKAFVRGEEVDVRPGEKIARDFKVTPLEEPNAKK